MSQLNRKGTKKRSTVRGNQFALPGRRYPVDTKKRAASAKARAQQQHKRGRLSRSQRDKVVAKANRKLRGG